MARDNFEYLLDMPDVPTNFAYLLDPLEDGSFAEYLPVDDFFDEYLAKLDFSDVGTPSAGMDKGARVETQRHDSLPLTEGSDGTTQRVASDASDSGRSMPPTGALDYNTSSSTPHTRTGPPANMQQQQSQSQQQQAPQQGWQSAISGQAGTSGVVTSGTQVVPSTAVVGAHPASVTSGAFASGSAVVSGIPEQLRDRQVLKPQTKRKRVRDDRQQLLNKLAQIRYRERKRTKSDTLQDQMTALEGQLAELKLKKNEAADLRRRNSEIEAKLAALNGPQGGADAVVRLQVSSKASAANPVPRDPQKELTLLVKQWLAKSKEIKDLVALIGLGTTNETSFGRWRNEVRRSIRTKVSSKTRDLLAHVELRMATMVSDVTTLCMRVMRLQGAQVEQLMVADYDMVCSMKGWKDEKKWLQAARALEFNPEQQRKVLLFREQSLQHLHELYEERQQLNSRVLSDLEPQLFGPAASTTEATNCAAADMLQVLEALAANLESEQRELAHQDWVLFRELLSPVQAGVLVAASFPDHCDAMALMNATAQLASTS